MHIHHGARRVQHRRDRRALRIVRDLRVHRILEGTNEIMRVITAREMLRQ